MEKSRGKDLKLGGMIVIVHGFEGSLSRVYFILSQTGERGQPKGDPQILPLFKINMPTR
jgi:hypothetical protein